MSYFDNFIKIALKDSNSFYKKVEPEKYTYNLNDADTSKYNFSIDKLIRMLAEKYFYTFNDMKSNGVEIIKSYFEEFLQLKKDAIEHRAADINARCIEFIEKNKSGNKKPSLEEIYNFLKNDFDKNEFSIYRAYNDSSEITNLNSYIGNLMSVSNSIFSDDENAKNYFESGYVNYLKYRQLYFDKLYELFKTHAPENDFIKYMSDIKNGSKSYLHLVKYLENLSPSIDVDKEIEKESLNNDNLKSIVHMNNVFKDRISNLYQKVLMHLPKILNIIHSGEFGITDIDFYSKLRKFIEFVKDYLNKYMNVMQYKSSKSIRNPFLESDDYLKAEEEAYKDAEKFKDDTMYILKTWNEIYNEILKGLHMNKTN